MTIERTDNDRANFSRDMKQIAKSRQAHTPGPWRVEPTQWNHGETTTITADDGFAVAEIHSQAWDEQARLTTVQQADRANARLMAAAPDVTAELRDTELNLVQMLIAVNIGTKTKQQQIDFMRGVVERKVDQIRALLARIDGD